MLILYHVFRYLLLALAVVALAAGINHVATVPNGLSNVSGVFQAALYYPALTIYAHLACPFSSDPGYCQWLETAWNEQPYPYLLALALVELMFLYVVVVFILKRMGVTNQWQARKYTARARELEREQEVVRAKTQAVRSEAGLADARFDYHTLKAAIKRVARKL